MEVEEINLWRAVIWRAIADAVFGEINLSENRKKVPIPTADMRNQAKFSRAWFKRGGKDYQIVCEFAFLDPTYVQERAILRIKQFDTKHPHMKRYLHERAAAAYRNASILGYENDRQIHDN